MIKDHKPSRLFLKSALLGVMLLGTSPMQQNAYAGSAYLLSPHKGSETSSHMHMTAISSSLNASHPSESLIQQLGQDAIGFLSDKSMSDDARKREFRRLLLSNFDMKTIGRFALGRYWRGASLEQRNEYLNLFEDMIIDVYSERFSEYSGQNLEIVGSRADGKKDMIVRSLVVSGRGSDITVDWRVRQKNDGSYKVIDVIVEGVSMSVTQRSDFSSVIQRGGGNIEVLLDHLRKS